MNGFSERMRVWQETKRLSASFPVPHTMKVRYDDRPVATKPRWKKTAVNVFDMDTIVLGKKLEEAGCDPLLLILADHRFAGGDVEHGSGAQEESMFRRTNLCRALRQQEFYPIQSDEALVCKGVTVFRDTEARGCHGIPPSQMDFIAVPGIQNPTLDAEGRMGVADLELLHRKIRLIFQCGLAMGKSALVLGAMGCGAWRCPPAQVAMVFREVLAEYQGYFKAVMFGCLHVPAFAYIVPPKDQVSAFHAFSAVLLQPAVPTTPTPPAHPMPAPAEPDANEQLPVPAPPLPLAREVPVLPPVPPIQNTPLNVPPHLMHLWTQPTSDEAALVSV